MRRAAFFLIFALVTVCLVSGARASFAAMPFADVPPGHWAYDAVAQLASAGVISGYPDGAFSGIRPVTRYEMASVTARCLARVDLEKEDKKIVDAIKRLSTEFYEELEAMGVRVDGIDERLGDIEKGVRGWYFGGNFRFTADFVGESHGAYNVNGNDRLRVDRFRWNIKRAVDENVDLFVTLQNSPSRNGFGAVDGFNLNRAYAIIKLPGEMKAYIGKQTFNWENGYTVTDYDGINSSQAVITDYDRMNAFRLVKSFQDVEIQAFVAHAESAVSPDINEAYKYGARVSWSSEKIYADLNYVRNSYGQSRSNNGNDDNRTVWLGMRWQPVSNLWLKGEYFTQELDWPMFGTDSKPSAYKIMLDIKQPMFKFTSLWLEYAHFDQNFMVDLPVYMWSRGDDNNHLSNGVFFRENTNIWNIYAGQQWNDQWYTYVRYTKWDSGNAGSADNWGMSVRYQYSHSLSFELMYDMINYSNTFTVGRPGAKDDHLLMFRTNVYF